MTNSYEWERFQIPNSSIEKLRFDNCYELDQVTHIVHVNDAQRIIEDGYIRAKPVSNESKIRHSGRRVVWVSANSWYNGSIYGTVEFVFNWKNLIRDRKIYWVESMQYNVPAYRFLITNREVSSNLFVRYNPNLHNGPIRNIEGKWFWNGNYTSEFMIEEDISLTNCVELNFITHHSDYCRLFGGKCNERLQPTHVTAGYVLAHILGNGSISANHLLIHSDEGPLEYKLKRSTNEGIHGICYLLDFGDQCSGYIKKRSERKTIFQSALILLGKGQISGSHKMIELLSSKKTFRKALQQSIENHFSITNFTVSL